MPDSLNPVGTTIGRDIDRKSITGECHSMCATMGNHGCSCWHHAMASISITIRWPDTMDSEGLKCLRRIDVRGGNPVGKPSGAHFRNNLFIYSSSPYTGNRSGGALKTANWYSKYKSPGTKYRVTANRRVAVIRAWPILRNRITASRQIAHCAVKRST